MTRLEIEKLAVGDSLENTHDTVPFSRFTKLLPNPRYGTPRKIVKISLRKENVKGELFVMGETEHGPNATITFSFTEGELNYRVAK